ncbi:MAG: amidohydrolase [Bacillota bacterium]|nr:amidohydrolase [Bacillota bacterium]
MKKASMVLHNGSIRSLDIQGRKTEYEAMAISEGKIFSLGAFDEMKDLIGEDTELMDLKGRSLLPGLSDSHLHAAMTTEMVFDFDLRGVDFSPEMKRADYIKAYQEILQKYLGAHPGPEADRVLRGTGWNPILFVSDPEGQPKASDLDAVCDDVPIMLRSFDHHYLWVNSKALELAGITKDTPTPRNGVVERDKEGNPTGIFQETTAMDLLIRNLPGADYTVEEYKEGIKFYQKEFGNKYGETLIFDAYCSENAVQAYTELEEAGELNLRVRTSFYADPSLPASQFDDILAKKDRYTASDGFAIQTVKFFIDGSGLSFYLREPFEKEWLHAIGLKEGYKGYSQWTQDELNEIFLKLDTAGFQIHLHCMADGAVGMALDAFEFVAKHNDIKKNRHTITHLMLAGKDDFRRMSEMGIIAAIQPMWAMADSLSEQSGAAMLGSERIHETYLFGSMKEAGCRLTCGTDFPVTIPPSPFLGIQTGVTREISPPHPEYETYKGLRLGAEDEKLTVDDLLDGYSISSAYQCFLENVTGSLETGKSADFVVLDRDIALVPEDEIGEIKVAHTYFKGREVYRGDEV